MTTKLTIIYPYYNNPEMFRLHQEAWRSYPKEIRNQIEVIVVDDGSQESPAIDAIAKEKINFPFRLFRIDKDIPWNQHGARNIGAHESACGWMFMTDMDKVLPCHTVKEIIKRINENSLDQSTYYMFEQLMAPALSPAKKKNFEGIVTTTHVNTFLFTKKLFWKAGGYDEIFSGIYFGDGEFRKRMERRMVPSARQFFNDKFYLISYRRTKGLPMDVSTQSLPRKTPERMDQLRDLSIHMEKIRHTHEKPLVLKSAYKLVFQNEDVPNE